MIKKSVSYTLFAIMVAASMVLSGCGGATTTPTISGITPQASQTPVPEKKVATFIWNEEFELVKPLIHQYVVFHSNTTTLGLLAMEF